jgi:heme/copper-type cytochrome/quinol oxidase subunit 4
MMMTEDLSRGFMCQHLLGIAYIYLFIYLFIYLHWNRGLHIFIFLHWSRQQTGQDFNFNIRF